jgi:hypothetical protein
MEAVFDSKSKLAGDVRNQLALKFPSFTSASLAEVTNGFLSAIPQGLDEVVGKLMDLWRTAPELQALRRKCGAALTPDVYARLIDATRTSIDDLWHVLLLLVRTDEFMRSLAYNALKAGFATPPPNPIDDATWKGLSDDDTKRFLVTFNPHFPFDYLSRLSFEPPEYVFVSGRLKTAGAPGDSSFRQLWNQLFHACDLGDNLTFWKFLLDHDSAIVVKLTGARTIGEILKEIQDSYTTAARPNPLGLPVGMALDDFIKTLDTQIVEKFWRGVLVIRPTMDISGDRQLSTLSGLQHIDALWCAVGGAKADSAGKALTLLDVYAYIHQEKTPQQDDSTPGDTSLTLIKFEATIRNTKLVAGEVIFRLDLRNLWGKTKDTFQFPPIMLRGTLPQDKTGSVSRSFEFAAWLPEPARFEIDLAFIHAFVFRSLRVGKNKGQTSVEIDGEIELKKWDTGINSFPFSIDPGQDDAGKPLNKIQLLNFRILVPEIPSGQSILMGARRLLNFEFPAVEFHVPKPRTINLWADIELTPFAMGFVRLVSDTDDAFKKLTAGYQWLFGDVKPTANSFPYMRCTIDFGKLPKFGGTQLSDLHFELLLGVILDGSAVPKVALGVSSLEARDIVLDLFGVLKLEVQDLSLGRFLSGPSATEQVTALMAKNVRLTILGWSPTPSGSELDLIFAQRPPDNQAALLWYSAAATTSTGNPQPPGDSFVRLNWLLLARNWAVNPKILSYLLDSGAQDAATRDLMKNLVTRSTVPGTPGKIDARVDKDAGWLFGIQFALGDILKDCTLVLHDQHYYGISLRGDLVQLLFEQPRLELAYIPGATRGQDRFRTSFRIPKLDMLGTLQSGEFAIEWGFNWDYLLDFGFPWKRGAAYVWERSFSMPLGAYEAKFGFYFEKRSQPAPNGATDLTLAAGVGFYVGYYVGFGTPGRFVWARAGIGVFAILEGSITFREPAGGPANLLKASIQEIHVIGVIGIFAYGEGGINIWVLSASFRVSIQAAIAGELNYIANASTTLAYAATLSAHYEASCRVGCGFFSFTFSVSGSLDFEVSGHTVLN